MSELNSSNDINDKYENLYFFGINKNYKHEEHFLNRNINQISSKPNHKSPLLTPGRKSASPTFFHQNDLVMHRIEPHQQTFNKSENNTKTSKNIHEEKFLSLQIPTTPTRSKSLSPSLRPIVQPPRIRHKENNSKNSYSKLSNNENSIGKFGIDTESSDAQHNNLYGNNKLMNNNTHSFSSANSAFESYLKLKKRSSTENYNFNRINNSFDESRSVSDLSSDCSVKSIESDHDSLKYISIDPIQHNVINNETKMPIQEVLTEKKLVKLRLPFNVRMLNLKNFSESPELYSKRKLAIPVIKMKNSLPQSLESNLEILEENIQFIINEKLKNLLQECKNELIEPAMKNIRLNFGRESVTDNDIMSLLLKLIDKAKDQNEVGSELLKSSDKFKLIEFKNFESDSISSNNCSIQNNLKRKLSKDNIDAIKNNFDQQINPGAKKTKKT